VYLPLLLPLLLLLLLKLLLLLPMKLLQQLLCYCHCRAHGHGHSASSKFDRKNWRISVLKSLLAKLLDHREWLEMSAFFALSGTDIFRGAPLAPVDLLKHPSNNEISDWAMR
jgi:hypothetical protein